MNHHISTSKSRGVIFMFLLLLLLMLIDVSKSIPTDINDVIEEKCAHSKCQTENECPADSKWQAVYIPEDADYPAAIAASTLEEQPFIKGYLGGGGGEDLESDTDTDTDTETETENDENYDVLEATSNPFDNIKIQVLGITEANRCCNEGKCICRACPPMPKCAANEVIIEVRAALGVPGKCCAIYACIPEINCNDIDEQQQQQQQQYVGKEFWRDACTKCKCFGADVLCHSQCQHVDEPKRLADNCFSEYHNQSMEHGSTWFEDSYCSECSCEHGEKHCLTNFCNALDCKHPVKRPFKCCPECPDDEPEPIVENVDIFAAAPDGGGAASTTESLSTASAESKAILLNSTLSTTTDKAVDKSSSNSILKGNATPTTVATTTIEQNSSTASLDVNFSEETVGSFNVANNGENVENAESVENATSIETSTENTSENTDSTTVEIHSTSYNNNNATALNLNFGMESSTTSSTINNDQTTTKSGTETESVSSSPTSSIIESSTFSTFSTTEAATTTNSISSAVTTENIAAAASTTTPYTDSSNTTTSTNDTSTNYSSSYSFSTTAVPASTALPISTALPTTSTAIPSSTAIPTTTNAIPTSNAIPTISTAIPTTENSTPTPYTQLTYAPTTTSAPAPLEPQPTVYRQLNNDEYEEQDIAHIQEQQQRFLHFNFNTKNIVFGGLILFAGLAFIVVIWWAACHTKNRRQIYSAIPKSEILGYNTGVVTIAATTGLNNAIKERKYYSTTPKSECSLSANSTSASVLTVESG